MIEEEVKRLRKAVPIKRSILDELRKGMQPAPKSSSILELVPNIEEIRHRLTEIQTVHKKLAEDLSGLGESMKRQAVRMEALATWLKAGKAE